MKYRYIHTTLLLAALLLYALMVNPLHIWWNHEQHPDIHGHEKGISQPLPNCLVCDFNFYPCSDQALADSYEYREPLNNFFRCIWTVPEQDETIRHQYPRGPPC